MSIDKLVLAEGKKQHGPGMFKYKVRKPSPASKLQNTVSDFGFSLEAVVPSITRY